MILMEPARKGREVRGVDRELSGRDRDGGPRARGELDPEDPVRGNIIETRDWHRADSGNNLHCRVKV